MSIPDFFTGTLRGLDNFFQAINSIPAQLLYGEEPPPAAEDAASGGQPAGAAGTGKTANSQQVNKEEDWEDILKRWAKTTPRSSIPQLPTLPSFPGQPYYQANPYAQVYMQYGPYDPYRRY